MRKNLFYIPLISLLVLVWAGAADAVVRTNTITASPNPARVNSEVTITLIAYDTNPQNRSILFIDLTVDGVFSGDRRACSANMQPASTCTVEFKKNFNTIKQYRIAGRAILTGDESRAFEEIFLNITATGAPPPPPPNTQRTPVIESISPAAAAINSVIDISGTDVGRTGLNFCSNINLDASRITVYFSQAPATMISTGLWQGSTCDVLKVLVPENLTPNQVAEVRVENTGGRSEPQNLNILAPVTPPWEQPPPSQGRIEGKLQVDWPSSPLGTTLQNNSTLPDLVKYFYEWGISLGGFAAFIVLILAGLQYLTSAGDAGKMKEAKDKIKNAALGLILLLASVLILNTINPQLTQLRIPSVDPQSTSLETTTIGAKDLGFGPCQGVKLYSLANYEPENTYTFLPAGGSINSPLTVGSIRTESNLCQVKLYQRANFIENADYPAIVLSSDTPNMSALGETNFASAEVIDLFPRK